MQVLTVESRRIPVMSAEEREIVLKPRLNYVLHNSVAVHSINISDTNDQAFYSSGTALTIGSGAGAMWDTGISNTTQLSNTTLEGTTFLRLPAPNGNIYTFEFRVSDDGQISIEPTGGESGQNQD